jgi:hypothetical protein
MTSRFRLIGSYWSGRMFTGMNMTSAVSRLLSKRGDIHQHVHATAHRLKRLPMLQSKFVSPFHVAILITFVATVIIKIIKQK